jgi:hypothetical protein
MKSSRISSGTAARSAFDGLVSSSLLNRSVEIWSSFAISSQRSVFGCDPVVASAAVLDSSSQAAIASAATAQSAPARAC